MKPEKLYELIDLAQQLRQAYPDGHPVFEKLSEAIIEGVADAVREAKGGLSWDQALAVMYNSGHIATVNYSGDLYVPGNIYAGGQVFSHHNQS